MTEETYLAANIYIATMADTAVPIIAMNSLLEQMWFGSFSTAEDNQTFLDVHLVYGTSTKVSQNTSIGRWRITGIPPLPAGIPHITITVYAYATGEVSIAAFFNKSQRLDVVPQTVSNRVPVR